ncbi:MAG: lytic transglycosylase protein [Alphaproteobacteria bacterium]|nr:lytic transglycosylase protein [Alphaproteobacteria bacterium]MDB5719796.1 lytic transglycosylase protein [Alphaproteobacteria bacterium]
MKLRAILLAAAMIVPAAPALAGGLAPTSDFSASDRTAWRDVFAALDASNWALAASKIDSMADSPVKFAAQAELYLAKGSPKVEVDQIVALLQKAPETAKADQLARLAMSRGATMLPPLPVAQNMIFQGSQPRRGRAKNVSGDSIADQLDTQFQTLLTANRPVDAEALYTPQETLLGAEARTEFQQRLAWSYYTIGDDASSYRLALLASAGSGDWSIQGAWVAGLAAWRMQNCAGASDAFSDVAARSSDYELVAAANFWAARADTRCSRPERVQARLRNAARYKETFYGLLAATALGIRSANYAGLHDYHDEEWASVAHKANVQTAITMAEIGERDLADLFIRRQAQIGGAADHGALLHLAADLNLASTQFWLAHNAPRGANINIAARYPRPDWRPAKGWRVDQSLIFAHALQESNFRTNVVSPAGAVGLLQVRPGTAGDIARARGEVFDRQQLTDPLANMDFGQSYIESLRDNGATGGLLPKVIAAYNCGPVPVAEWNTRRFDKGDPLLYIESIPYWETRFYVPSVLRNYWIYEQEAGKSGGSREALVAGMWPRFPGMSGARAVRIKPEAANTALALGTN